MCIHHTTRTPHHTQGDVLDNLPDLVLKTFGDKNGIQKKHIFSIDDKKKKVAVYDSDDESDDE